MDCSNGWAVTIRAATYAGRIQRFAHGEDADLHQIVRFPDTEIVTDLL
jgi:hypothetical protein